MQHELKRCFVLAVPVTLVVLTFGAFVLVLWGVGLFDFTGTDASVKIVSASIALVAGLLSSLVSIIGLIFRYSLDQRNIDIREQAEKRLKLEAAIQALGLLSTSTGSPAPQVQCAGALFTLTSLGRYDLSTALTMELLTSNGIDAFSASLILHRAMESGDQRMQEDAIGVFSYCIDKFLTPNGAVELPDSLSNWRSDLSEYSRRLGTFTLGKLLIARPLSEWTKPYIRTIVSALSLAWIKEEKDDVLKQDIGAILKNVLKIFPDIMGIINHPSQQIDIDDIRSNVAFAKPVSHSIVELVDEIDKWATTKDC
jgi:hypothetical protein